MRKSLNSISDRWELVIYGYDITNIPKLIYKRKCDNDDIQEMKFPLCMPLQVFFADKFSHIPEMVNNQDLLYDEITYLPLTLRTYFSTKEPEYNKSFIKFIFSVRFNDTNPDLLKQCYEKETFPDADIKYLVSDSPTKHCSIRIYNPDIVGYVVNSLVGVCDHYYGDLYMIIEEGTWLSKKEEKKRMILLNAMGCQFELSSHNR